MRNTIFLFLIVSFLFSGAALAQPPIAPTPANPENNERTIGNYTVAQSFETGYRFLSVDGNETRYRSDVNYGNGIRLLGSQMSLHSKDGHGRLFDELTLSTQGLGNDPYQAATMRLGHNRLYRYNLTWRLNEYLNPGLRAPFGQHSMNTRRQWQDHDVTLLPGAPIQFLAGVSRNTQSGPALSTIQLLNAQGDEYPLFTDISRKQTEIRTGVQVGTQKFRMLLLRGWQRYNEAAPATSGASAGFNTANAIRLTSLNRQEPYTGNSPYWRGNLIYEPSTILAISARFDHTSGRRDFRLDETALASDRFGNNTNRQTVVTGTGTRPVSSGALTFTLTPSDRVTVTNQTTFHQIQMNGNSRWAEVNNSAQGLNLVEFQYLGIRTAVNTTDVNVQATKWLGAFGGFQYSNRRVKSTVAETSAGFTDRLAAEQTNNLKAGTGGVRIKPAGPLTIVLDGEVGRADRPFLPISDRNYHAFGARAQYRTSTFTLTAASRLNYNTNSAALTSFSSRNRNNFISGTWTPTYRFSVDAGYAKLHTDTLGGLNYFVSFQETSGQSRYISNIHSTHATARIVPHSKFEVYFGITRVQDTGDGQSRPNPALTLPVSATVAAQQTFAFYQVFPLSFSAPQARVSAHLRKNLTWNFGYQHYHYDEQQFADQNYHAHTGYTSLLWSF